MLASFIARVYSHDLFRLQFVSHKLLSNEEGDRAVADNPMADQKKKKQTAIASEVILPDRNPQKRTRHKCRIKYIYTT